MAKIKTRNTTNHGSRPRGINKSAFEKVYRPYLPILLLVTLLLGFGVRTGNLNTYVHHPSGRVLSYATSMSIDGLLADTNTQRTSNSVGSLTLNQKLDAAAQAKADDMAARNYWSHNTPEGNPPWVFVTNQGYSYQKLGENLATGFVDEQSTINGWMASPPHRENLLDPNFTEVGFGYSNNPNYTAAGGGPMTIVVAFYGEPKVLSASTVAPSSSPPVAANPASTPVPSAQSQVTPSGPAPTSSATPQQATEPVAATKKTKATTTNPANYAPIVKSSRMQLVIGNTPATSAISALSVMAAALIAGIWIRRHGLAMHKFLLKGERYMVHHPLTEIGLVMIAALLFILSQTAGLVQ